MENYTIPDIAATLNVSERTVQRWVEKLVIKDGNKILIPEDVFNLLKSRHVNDTNATLNDNPIQDFERVEHFTEEEYQEFHKRLSEYPILKDQLDYLKKDIAYHKKSIESHNRQMELLLLSVSNNRFIEE